MKDFVGQNDKFIIQSITIDLGESSKFRLIF